jgi:hypothetical protein
MKNFLLSTLFLIGIVGCASLELEAVSTSDEETQRILALGLSHEENLVEASKLRTPHMVSVVSLQLTNARDEKIQAEIDLVKSEEFSKMVIVSESEDSFIGPTITETIKTGVLQTDIDSQNSHLEGVRDLSNGIIDHKLVISISHNSKNERKYDSANLCDEWNRCNMNLQNITNISSNASNCKSEGCDFTEVLELNLDDDFLRDYPLNGYTFRINSNRKSNKVNISKAYLMGYLKIAQ